MENGDKGLIITGDLPGWKMVKSVSLLRVTYPYGIGEKGLIITGDLPG